MRALSLATGLMIGLSGAAFAADPAVGTWKTETDDGNYAYVEIDECGTNLCGTFVRTFNSEGEYQSQNIGKRMLWDMTPTGDGSYNDGKVWRPSNDKVYLGKMQINGGELYLSGCVKILGVRACKDQTWTRVR